MERREPAADTGRLDSPKASLDTPKAWEAVRRALGRLLGRVGVHETSDAERTIPAAVLTGDLTLPPPGLPPIAWQPGATVCVAPVPEAGAGLRESDLLPSITLARGDYAVTCPEIRAMSSAEAAAAVESVPLDWLVGVTRLPDTFVHLPPSPLQLGAVPMLMLPSTAALKHWPMPLPTTHPLRLPRLDPPRVRWAGDSLLRRMPLTRHGRTAADPSAARRRLAETARLTPEAVALLGVYPDVPILAVERIVVEEEGRRLRLWLKPDILRHRSGSHRITLLVGRELATGKMLQAAL